jgi:hypothetical protein
MMLKIKGMILFKEKKDLEDYSIVSYSHIDEIYPEKIHSMEP